MRLRTLLVGMATAAIMAASAFAQVLVPSGLTVTPISDTALRLNWVDNSSNESGFWVMRATNQAGSFVRIATLPANTTTYDDTGLPSSTTRHYRIIAFKNSQVTVVPEESSDVSVGVSGITMSPNQPPVAVDDTNQGIVPPTIQLSGNVLTNDTDPNSDTLSVLQPNANIAANGAYNITFDTSGEFDFPYVVIDGRGGQDDGNLHIVIEQANTPPVAVDDSATGLTNTAIVGNVLTNDTDIDGDTLSVVQPNPDIDAFGNFSKTYTSVPSPNPVVINYTVSDGQGGTDTGELKITVNTPPPPPGEITAFPGADGFGRFSKGGRGGQVIFVTNLNSSGPGSLKACVLASGPRTCVFNKLPAAGYIQADVSTIEVQNPFLTIAGETAPGKGITMRNLSNQLQASPMLRISTHDVIIRHMRFRPGNPPHNNAGTPNGDGIAFGQVGAGPVYNIMMDHLSFSWATDENVDFSPLTETLGQASAVDRATLQNSLIYEGLKPHSKGPNLRSCGISLVKNLIASNTIRNPNNTCGKLNPGGVRSGGGITGDVEFRNNVVYNGVEGFFDMWDGRGEGWSNIVGNVFIKGPSSLQKLGTLSHDVYPVDAWTFRDRFAPSGTCAQNGSPSCNPDADPLHMYVSGNIFLPGAGKTWPTNGIADGSVNPNDAHLLSTTPVGDGFGEDGITGTIMPAVDVENHVKTNAGAFPNNRDTADAGIVTNVTNRTGSIPTCATSSTQAACNTLPWPTLPAGTNYPDTDNDGMDDTWETNVGGMSATANGDHDSDGWTNLEEFLHFLAATR